MRIFFSNYHVAVNKCFVDDVLATGHEVVMPTRDFLNTNFFAPNDEHFSQAGVYYPRSYGELMSDGYGPMAIVIPCMQMFPMFKKLWVDRDKKDVLIYMPVQSESLEVYDFDSDFIITHDLNYHRASPAKYKILYFSRPLMFRGARSESDCKFAYYNRDIDTFVHNLYTPRMEQELRQVNEFQDAFGRSIRRFGCGCPNLWINQQEVQERMAVNMFTLSYKRPETWAQTVLQSMLIGTPCIFLKQFMSRATIREYLITPDNSIIGDSPRDCVDQINKLSFEQYLTMCVEACSIAEMYCNDELRINKLEWLLDKAELRLNEING